VAAEILRISVATQKKALIHESCFVTNSQICAIGVTLPLFEHYADGADSK